MPVKGNENKDDTGDNETYVAPPLTQSKAYGVGEDET